MAHHKQSQPTEERKEKEKLLGRNSKKEIKTLNYFANTMVTLILCSPFFIYTVCGRQTWFAGKKKKKITNIMTDKRWCFCNVRLRTIGR
jgi:hypothetical protein